MNKIKKMLVFISATPELKQLKKHYLQTKEKMLEAIGQVLF
jgi:hypothetical protein